MEKRLYERFKTGSDCKLKCAIADKVRIKDVSMGGICLETSRYINTNNIYYMKIVTKKNEEIELAGHVVRSSFIKVRKSKEDISSVYEIGLNFIEQDNDKKKFLKKLAGRLTN
jgi:hypothetical protein